MKEPIQIIENNEPLELDYNLKVVDIFLEEDGHVDPKRLKVTFSDVDYDGLPDDPYLFNNITALDFDVLNAELVDVKLDSSELFFKITYDINGYPVRTTATNIVAAFNELTSFDKAAMESAIVDANDDLTGFTFTDGDVFYIRSEDLFYQYNELSNTFSTAENYEYRRGRNDLKFIWKHYAPIDNRIDPSPTNIIDNYVLTIEYDFNIRSWIDSGGSITDMPEAPSSEDLKIMFTEIESKKTISDQIVWHPVIYKVLFGSQAPEELRATFKVTKIPGVSLSDGEIKSKIINAINVFFALSNWDFGETFYFTELSAFVHQQLATIISSFVIVPLNEESKFGDLFQIRSAPNEVFISSAKVSDVQIVDSLNENTIRIGN